ncbi:MAG TPA: bifunctional DNA-binding transcriptional regulator/O6-methylguanine-DNA methyltransferase Ada [Ktedonobacterales bacterium]|jgi:AraC family transcriptional regulator of adaptative response/methylated-DNA-[protein]-cysteine methyltransferase
MNEERCWQAFSARDKAADGQFVVAVRSTGIYCRPSCPSRRPKRENVLFFAEPGTAEQAGYRACLRCRPRQNGTPEEQVTLVQQICRVIEQHPEGSPSLEELGTEISMSPFHLQRTFKRVLGITPRQYAEAHRLGRLKERLREGESVTQALYGVGYSSSSRLYEQANARLGMTPATYGKGGKGMQISYTIANSPLGAVLVAMTERGICMVSLGESEAYLIQELTSDYPAAQIQRAEGEVHAWVSAILDYLNGRAPSLDLPLDVQATAFQWQVWQALQAIPVGSTRTYSELAEAIGHPRAARAVGNACANNPVSLVVPCHRAIREDGSLGGYRWGLERKKRLLAQERERAQKTSS